MRNEQATVIELGQVSTDTRGLTVGITESEFGMMMPTCLDED